MTRTRSSRRSLSIVRRLGLLLAWGLGAPAAAQEVPPDTALAGTYELVGLAPTTVEVEVHTLVDGALHAVTRRYAAEAGTLLVPEHRGQPGTRRIELPVVRIRATRDTNGPPIFWFEGGPGQSNLHTFDFDYFIDRHDHVMVGYRGVDGSVSLDCPEVTAVLKRGGDVLADATLEHVGDAYAACWDRLQSAGVDVDGYTTVDVVKDVESARRALGYSRVDLVAESYGTRLAYLYGVLYPAALHCSVMVGANPPGGMVWDPRQMDALIRRYGILWADDPDASARTPDLVGAIRAVNGAMPRRWMGLPIHPGNVQVSAFAMLFERETAAAVFDAYVAAADGDASGLWLISAAARFIFPEIVNWGDNASKAVSADYDSSLADVRTFIPDAAVMGAPLGRFLWAPAGRWPIAPIPSWYRRVHPSDVPTLVISGSLDLSTPAVNAERVLLPALRNGRHVVLAERGHVGDLWTVDPAVTERLVSSFLETGTVDRSTVRRTPVDFSVRWPFPMLAKLIVAAGALGVVLVLGTVWGIVRIVRRRRRR